MVNLRSGDKRGSTLTRAALFVSLATLGVTSAAQTPRSPIDRVSPRDRDISDRQIVLRDAERPVVLTREEAQLKLNVIKDAFKRLQDSNNSMRAVAGSGCLDYRRLIETANDVRKQAGRLKSTLVLPASDRQTDVRHTAAPTGERQMLTAIAELDRAIQSFVTNKVFRDLKVSDQRLAAQASRDLDAVVDISNRISSGAKRLGKTTQKSAQP